MSQLFEDEVLSVTLRFANPNKREMADADKAIASMSKNLDSIVRTALRSGQSIDALSKKLSSIVRGIDNFQRSSQAFGGTSIANQRAKSSTYSNDNIDKAIVSKVRASLSGEVADSFVNKVKSALARYTPDRLSAISETSVLRKQAFGNKNSAMSEAFKKIEGQMHGVVKDAQARMNEQIRTAKIMNVMIVDVEATTKQALEVHARVVEYNTVSQEFGKTLAKYTGYQRYQNLRLAQASKLDHLLGAERTGWGRQNLPRDARFIGNKGLYFGGDPQGRQQGLRQGVDAAGISGTVLRYMMRKADVMLGHWPVNDIKHLSKFAPTIGTQKPWLDSASLPYKTLGFPNGSQQALIKAHGINQLRAHRGESDVLSLQDLMGSSHPQAIGGGKKYFTMLLEQSFGPTSEAAEFVKVLSGAALDLRQEIKSQLRESTRYLTGRKPNEDVDFIRGKRMGDKGKRYSHAAPDSTPPDMSPGLILKLDTQLSAIQEFLRNSLIVPPSRLLTLYQSQSSMYEARAQQFGNGGTSGEDFLLKVLSGVNEQVDLLRSNPTKYRTGLMPIIHEDRMDRDYRRIEGTLRQAGSAGKVSDQEVMQFLRSSRGGGPGVIAQAAQFANSVGRKNPLFNELTKLITDLQVNNFGMRRTRRASPIIDVGTSAAKGLGEGGFDLLSALNKGSLRTVRGGGLNSGFAGLGGLFSNTWDAFKKIREERAKRQAESNQTESIMGGYDSPRAIRASIRADRFTNKIQDLEKEIEETALAFKRFADVVDRKKVKLAEDRDLRTQQILSGVINPLNRLDQKQAAIDAQRTAAKVAKEDSVLKANLDYEARLASLRKREVEAEINAITTRRSQTARIEALKRSKTFKELGAPERQGALDAVEASGFKAARGQSYAEYNRRIAEGESPAELIPKFAQMLLEDTPGNMNPDYQRILAGMAARNPLMAKNQALDSADLAELSAQEALDKKQKEVDRNRRQLHLQTNQKKLESDKEYSQKSAALEDKLTDKRLAATTLIGKMRERMARVINLFGKNEQLHGGGSGIGGVGRGGVGGGHGSPDDFASRGGMDLGIGLASVTAYNAALWEGIKATTIYAARTQTLTLVTDQMARVNGLSVDGIKAEVEAVKSLNITTQEANTTVQKMIFAQLDAAKATNLARTAQDAGILANVNSSEALDKIILGVVTGQTRVLHNMNLQVSMLQVLRQLRLDKRAKGETGEPTELEKKQGMLNAVLMEGAKIFGTYERSMLTAGKQFNSLRREIEETQNVIGNEFLPEFGRFVSLTTSGLKVMQQNGDLVAKFATGLLSLGTAASTVGSLAFMRWLMTTPAIPPAAKLIGGVAGLATMYATNLDTGNALTSTATERHESINRDIKKLREERKKLFDNKEETPEWRRSLEFNTQMLKSATDSQVAINKTLTEGLAQEYGKRLNNIQGYIDDLEGKNSYLAKLWAQWNGNPQEGLGSRTFSLIMDSNTSQLEVARLNKANLIKEQAKKLATKGVSEQDIIIEFELQEKMKNRRMSPTLFNKEQAEIRQLVAEMSQAQGELLKLDEKLSETGTIGLRARKAMGSPREKINLDYSMQVSKIKGLAASLVDLQTKAEGGDLSAKVKIQALAKDLGGGSQEAGKAKIEDFISKRDAVLEEAATDRDIQLSKINRSNAAQLVQTNESIDLARIEATTIKGNYDSELQAIDKLFAVKQANAKKVMGFTGDVDQYTKQIAQNEADRTVAQIKLEQQVNEARKARLEESARDSGSFKARAILSDSGSGDYQTALSKAFAEEYKATLAITDSEKRKNAQLELTRKLRDENVKLAQDEARAAADFRISQFQDASQLKSEIDQIISGRGKSNSERSLMEIERSRNRAIAEADFAYKQKAPITKPEDQMNLSRERNQAEFKANTQAISSTIKELDQNVEAARGRLADSYRMQYQRMERIQELTATNATDEAAAAANTHRMRLEFIDKEFAARGRTIEAQKDREKQIQDAEFDHLQKLLELRKKELDGVKSAAGSVFDALTTRDSGGLGSLVQAQNRVVQRQVFQNVAGEYFGATRSALGRVIKGQETTDASGNRKATLLGRVLSGTVFSPSHTEDIDRLMLDVTKENTSAQEELTTAIKSLDIAIRQVGGIAQGAGGAAGLGGAMSMIPGLGGFSNMYSDVMKTGVLGGQDSSNPMIFHAAGGDPVFSATGYSRDLDSIAAMQPNWNGTPVGENTGKMIWNGQIVDMPKTSRIDQGVGSLVGGMTGQYNAVDLLTSSSVRTGSGSATGLSKVQRTAAIAGMAAVVGGGVMEAINRFKQGGARGIASGITGVLAAASVIPGPQQPFIMAAAAITGMLKGFFGDPKQNRQREIDTWMNNNKYIAPVEINSDQTLSGNTSVIGKDGLTYDTGTGAFPIATNPTEYRQALEKYGMFDGPKPWDPYIEIPGSQLDKINPGSGYGMLSPLNPNDISPSSLMQRTTSSAPTQIYINIPISSFDSTDVLRRSPDIAAAITKELKLGSDVSIEIQRAIFGAS